MSKKKQVEEPAVQILGRVKNHLKMGIVGLPNVGKSSLFNVLTKTQVKAENFPFCTIEPNEARVILPDNRYDWLCETYQPKSKVPAYLEVWDIAGLVKGASEGEGLGNAFLSHISSVDGIYHCIRLFDDPDVTHVEGEIDPLRDLEIIENELRLKDLERVKKAAAPVIKLSNADPKKRPEAEMYKKFIEVLESGKDIKDVTWGNKEIDLLNTLLLITAKPVVYLINMSTNDYVRQKNKWLRKVVMELKQKHPHSSIIPFSVAMEQQLVAIEDPAERAALLQSYGEKVTSALDKIIQAGFNALNLYTFFTCGPDEVRAWPIMGGWTAPQAAGTIHGDFEKCFIKAEVMSFDELKEHGSEAAMRAVGRYRTEGKKYIVQDGDILLIKHNAKK